jgi:hypothetical protein
MKDFFRVGQLLDYLVGRADMLRLGLPHSDSQNPSSRGKRESSLRKSISEPL